MRTAGVGFVSMLSEGLTTIATLWRLSTVYGVNYYFTDHNKDIVHLGNTYVSAVGFSSSAMHNKSNLSVDSLDIQGMLSASGVSELQIFSGSLDYAEVEIKLLNYTGNLDTDFMTITKGTLGEISSQKFTFNSELRTSAEKLQRVVGVVYSPTCRALLGDSKCKFNLASGSTVQGTPGTFSNVPVTSVTDRQTFFMGLLAGDTTGVFSGGFVSWVIGLNSGLSTEIKQTQKGRITLVMPMPNTIQIGDTATVVVGCDKRFSTCVGKFNNAVNFRGEPHVPGTDKILETSANNSKSKV